MFCDTFDCWKHLLRQQDIAVILVFTFNPGLTNISSVVPTCDTATDTITDMRSRRLGSICRFLLSTYWCINPIVLRAEWWFDGKQFSSLNHMKSNCSSYSSCLQVVSRAIGFRQLLYATLVDTVEQKDRDKLFCVLSVSL